MVARYLFLIFGTILSALFLVQLWRGGQYDVMLENLDGVSYPGYPLYGVGFSWSNTGILSFQGKLAGGLKQDAAFLYEAQYADYYANVTWAQALTFAHLGLSLSLILAGVFYGHSSFVLSIGLFLTVFATTYSLTKMKNKVNDRKEQCESQLAEMVSTMAVLLNTGMVMHEVWERVSENGSGALYELMRDATENMANGVSESDAIYHFGRLSASSEVKKFASAMLQSMEKGGGELSLFMEKQSSELWHMKRQRMLQMGEKASTKLLAPTMVVFLGVIIIVITAAFAGALF